MYNKGNKFYIDDQLAGYGITLSTAQDLKSANFDKVKFIIFDEFILDEGIKKYYLTNEVEVFLNLIETIARMRDIRVFMLGNAGNLVTNPYFLYFNLDLPKQTDIRTFRDGLILLQYMKNEEYRTKKKESKLGKLTAGTNFEKFAIDNQDTKIDESFIEKKKGTSKFNFAFLYNNIYYGVWFDYSEGKVYVSNDYFKNSPNIFALTLKDHNENTMLIKSITRYSCWKKFIENFELGNVRYESQMIKQQFTEIVKRILTR